MKVLLAQVQRLCKVVKRKGILTKSLDVRPEVQRLSEKAKELDKKMRGEGLPSLRTILLAFQERLP